jgi:membrane-bound toxin of toxin-antitoxin system
MHKFRHVDISLGPSRRACLGVAFLAAAGVSVLVMLPIHPLAIVSGVIALAGWAGNRIWVIGMRRGPRAVRALRIEGDRTVVATLVSGEKLTGQVQEASYVGAIVTTLTWKSKGALCARSVLILPDMLSPEDFRRLRILLRYGRSDDSAAVPASHA